jgi:hypothetical protein
MIISHPHKYLFIELPRTGTTAISRELCALYEGEPILHKHATYLEFLKAATPDEKKYFVFAGIRNPMDDAVSLYFKYRNDHRNLFTNPKKLAKLHPALRFFVLMRFRFINRGEVDFPTYFRRYHRIPYDNWSSLSHKDFNFVVRFEHLAEDFERALRLIGLELKRPLLPVNTTAVRTRDYLAYYTPDIRAHAKRVFGPYMKKWGYRFPPEWGEETVSRWNQLEYEFYGFFRGIYWRYFRPRLHAPAHHESE